MKYFHAVSRFDHVKNFEARSVFHQGDYKRGIAVNMGIIVGVGTLLTLIAIAIYVHSCYRKPKEKTPWRRTEKFFGIGALVLIVCAFVSASQVSRVVRGVLDVNDSFYGIQLTLNHLGTDSAAKTVNNQMRDVQNRIEALRTIVFESAADPDFKDPAYSALSETETRVSEALDASSEVVNKANSLSVDLSSLHGYIHDTVKPMRGTGIAYVVVASIWSLLVMVSFLRKPQCATVFRVFIVLGVCLVFITWSFTSLALGVALVFSDGCRYPEFTALAMMDVTTPPPYPPQLATLDPTLYYYLTCDVAPTPLYGAAYWGPLVLPKVQAANGTLDTTFAALDKFLSTDANVIAHKAAIATAVSQAIVESPAVSAETSCSVTNTLWTTGRHQLCSRAMDGIATLFGFQILSSITLFIMVMVAKPFWNSHPFLHKKPKSLPLHSPPHELQGVPASSGVQMSVRTSDELRLDTPKAGM